MKKTNKFTIKGKAVQIETDDSDPHGRGEPAMINMDAVIANTVFDTTGNRQFEWPMNPARVRATGVAK